jgi:hypothetical protein
MPLLLLLRLGVRLRLALGMGPLLWNASTSMPPPM